MDKIIGMTILAGIIAGLFIAPLWTVGAIVALAFIGALQS